MTDGEKDGYDPGHSRARTLDSQVVGHEGELHGYSTTLTVIPELSTSIEDLVPYPSTPDDFSAYLCASARSTELFRPCPMHRSIPPSGTHHYRFTIYALDDSLNLAADAGTAEARTRSPTTRLAKDDWWALRLPGVAPERAAFCQGLDPLAGTRAPSESSHPGAVSNADIASRLCVSQAIVKLASQRRSRSNGVAATSTAVDQPIPPSTRGRPGAATQSAGRS